MLRFILGASILLGVSTADAQDDNCIENIAGDIVCGSDADAVRARLRAEARHARHPDRPIRSHSGSIYDSFGQSLFVRGGYIFAAHGGGVSDQASAPMAAVGYRSPMSKSGPHQWNFETEIVYVRDSEDILSSITVSGWALTGLLSLRWEYDTGSPINPYVSAGVGPTYAQLKTSNGMTQISDGEWAFGYSGRAGIEAYLSNGFSMEAGYRYLGATSDGTGGLHTGEVGLNYNF